MGLNLNNLQLCGFTGSSEGLLVCPHNNREGHQGRSAGVLLSVKHEKGACDQEVLVREPPLQ